MSKTQNLHIAALCRMIRTYRKEVCYSASSNLALLKEADHKRWLSYLDDVDDTLDKFSAKPFLDLPESHGANEIDLGEAPAAEDRENQGVNMLCQYFIALEDEVVNCQSSRLSNGLVKHDYDRFKQVIAAMKLELADMAAKLPLDLPETIPSRAGVTAGNRGINPGAA